MIWLTEGLMHYGHWSPACLCEGTLQENLSVDISGVTASHPCLAVAPAQTPPLPPPTPTTPPPPATTMTTRRSDRMPAPTTWLPPTGTLIQPCPPGGGPMMGGGHPSTATRGRSPTCLVLVTAATMGIWVLETSFTLATGHMTVLTTLWPVSRNSGPVYLSVCLHTCILLYVFVCLCTLVIPFNSLPVIPFTCFCYSVYKHIPFFSHPFVILFMCTFFPQNFIILYFFHNMSSCYVYITLSSYWIYIPFTSLFMFTYLLQLLVSQLCLCLHTFHNSWSSCLCVCVPFTAPGLPVYVCILLTVCGLPAYV